MGHFLALLAAFAGRAAVLCCVCGVFLKVVSYAVLAQTTGMTNPSLTPAEPSTKDDLPQGSCMPIGLTASGEMVFPILCRELIEREREKVVEHKSATPEEEKRPAAEEVSPAKNQEAAVPEISKPEDRPVETSRLQKRVEREPAERAIGPPGCTRFRSYNRESGTYRNYMGRRISCR
jgi:hypothetical protein